MIAPVKEITPAFITELETFATSCFSSYVEFKKFEKDYAVDGTTGRGFYPDSGLPMNPMSRIGTSGPCATDIVTPVKLKETILELTCPIFHFTIVRSPDSIVIRITHCSSMLNGNILGTYDAKIKYEPTKEETLEYLRSVIAERMSDYKKGMVSVQERIPSYWDGDSNKSWRRPSKQPMISILGWCNDYDLSWTAMYVHVRLNYDNAQVEDLLLEIKHIIAEICTFRNTVEAIMSELNVIA